MKYVYTYNLVCKVCSKSFQTKNYSAKVCSKECTSKLISSARIKYSDYQNNTAIKLRQEGLTIKYISKQLSMGKDYLSKLFRKNNVKLKADQKAQNLRLRWDDHNPIVSDHKRCPHCDKFKPTTDFNKDSRRKTKLSVYCSACESLKYQANKQTILKKNKERRAQNPEAHKQANKRYYQKHKSTLIEKVKAYNAQNPEVNKKAGKKWRDNNKPHRRMMMSIRRAITINATPTWLTAQQKQQIADIYNNCPDGFHVDHIVPLNGEIVCGLHVPWNLQVLEANENLSKGNTLPIYTSVGICHQYKIRQQTLKEDLANGAPTDTKIKDYNFQVEKLNREHKSFIERYEWLGTIGRGTKWVFTARYNGLLGGVILLSEPNNYVKSIAKNQQALIHRGACAAWTPKNLASKLIAFACRWMVDNTEKRLFCAYSDPEAGEIGTVYQACNFDYIGNNWGAKAKYTLPQWWGGKTTTSQYFNQTSFYKKACKHLGIQWLPEWSKANGFKDISAIPRDVKLKIKELAQQLKSESQMIPALTKGKYLLLLGKNKTEQRHLNKLKIWKPLPYPKREINT